MGLRPPRKFETAKAGNRPEECEDASLAAYPYNGGPARIAVCDGASESAFARQWAQILAGAFVHRPLDLSCLDDSSLTVWLAPCQEEWNGVVPWERIPWHGEAKTRAGAMAALVGLEIDQTANGAGAFPWQAVAVGDCCLFVVRGDDLAVSFPLESAAQFNNTPSLICSNPVNNAGLWPRGSPASGRVPAGGPDYPGIRRAGLLDTARAGIGRQAVGNAIGAGFGGGVGGLGAGPAQRAGDAE